MNKPNNPPAFPNAEDHKVAADLEWTTGMTLRDYFATKALQGFLAKGAGSAFEAVSSAYLIADVMLAEREKQTE